MKRISNLISSSHETVGYVGAQHIAVTTLKKVRFVLTLTSSNQLKKKKEQLSTVFLWTCRISWGIIFHVAIAG